MNFVLIALASLSVAFFMAMMKGYAVNNSAIAEYLIGSALVITGLTAVIVLVIAGFRRLTTGKYPDNTARSTWITWAVISSITMFGTYTNTTGQRADRQETDAAPEGMADVYDQALVTGEYQEIEIPSGTNEEPGLIVELVNRINEQERLIDEKLAAQSESIGTPRLFDLELLRDKNNLALAQKSYTLLKQANIDSREERLLMLSDAKEEIMNMPSSEASRTDAARGFERSHQSIRNLIIRFFDSQILFCDEAISYFDFMKTASYGIQGEQILFDSGSELDRYNDYILEFQHIAEIETQAAEELEDFMNKQIDRARSARGIGDK